MSDKVLKCYKVIETDGLYNLIKYEIPEWQSNSKYSRVEYTFDGHYIGSIYHHEYVKSSQINRVVHNKVFTFDLTDAEVKFLITMDLRERKEKAEMQVEKYNSKLEAWSRYLEGDNNGE